MFLCISLLLRSAAGTMLLPGTRLQYLAEEIFLEGKLIDLAPCCVFAFIVTGRFGFMGKVMKLKPVVAIPVRLAIFTRK